MPAGPYLGAGTSGVPPTGHPLAGPRRGCSRRPSTKGAAIPWQFTNVFVRSCSRLVGGSRRPGSAEPLLPDSAAWARQATDLSEQKPSEIASSSRLFASPPANHFFPHLIAGPVAGLNEPEQGILPTSWHNSHQPRSAMVGGAAAKVMQRGVHLSAFNENRCQSSQ